MKPKISEMIAAYAGDFIAMGEGIEERQEYLNCAASAWNIAYLNKRKREREIKRYMKKYRKLNPTHNKQDCRDTEENLRLLIKQKLKLYPNVRIQVMGATIEQAGGGKDRITVISAGNE